MKELNLSLTLPQAKQLYEYIMLAEESNFEYGNKKQFWKRHEIIIDKLQGVIYEFKANHPKQNQK